MKRKAIIPLLLGLGIGLAAVKLAVNTIRKAQAANQNKPTIDAIRARQDIGAFEEITAEMVEVIKTVDSAFAPSNERIGTIEEVVGRVSAKAIPQHAAVLQSMLAAQGTKPGMQGRIPPGYRAVSVKIDEVTGVAYQLQPGDWVDVIVVMDIDSAVRGKKETIAEVILQRIEVAAIGHATQAKSSGIGSSTMKPAKSATLLVREKDVPKLHLAGTRGKITLAMRGDDANTTDKPPSANMGDVIAALGDIMALESDPPTVVRASYKKRPRTDVPHAVLVYRGSSANGKVATGVERITFQHKNSPRIINVAFGPPTRSAAAMGGAGHEERSTEGMIR